MAKYNIYEDPYVQPFLYPGYDESCEKKKKKSRPIKAKETNEIYPKELSKLITTDPFDGSPLWLNLIFAICMLAFLEFLGGPNDLVILFYPLMLFTCSLKAFPIT